MAKIQEVSKAKTFNIRLRTVIGLLLIGVFLPGAFAATSVIKNGITWNFGANYQTGQYANGDYWVLDSGSGVQVTSVSPSPSGSSNGSMINPMGGSSQGYDGRVDGYSSSLSISFPKTLHAGDSLVSTQSRNATTNSTDLLGAAVQPAHCYIQRAAVLTVVSSVPSANSFRPPYVGTSKPTFLTTSLDRSKLMKLPLAGKPSATYVTEVAGYFKEVWLDHKPGWTARMMHPLSNMPNYGREIGTATSAAICLLLLDYTDQQLDPLLINYVQTGIDLYYMSLLSNNWYGDGGHANGRKWPILFAGIMLNNSAMKAVNCDFGEDDQTYYGTTASANPGQSKVAYWGRNCTSAYTSSCSGTGTKDCKPSSLNGDGCQDYRNCCTSYTWVGTALAVRLMQQTALWNHEAYFDYVDRWMGYGNDPQVGSGDWVQPGDTGVAFIKTMWDTYRSQVSNPPPPNTNNPPNANAGSDQTITDTDNSGNEQVILNGSGSSDTGGSIVSYTWTEGSQTIATGVNPTVNLATGQHTIILTVTDNGGLTAADTVVINITTADKAAPNIVSITCPGTTSVEIIFNEALDIASAQLKSNYGIDNYVSITSAVYQSSTRKVILTTSTQNLFGVYHLTVSNVRDLSGNTMTAVTKTYTNSSGLAGYWEFTETSGTSAQDWSGINNHGILLNGASWTGQSQIQFNGITHAVQIPTNNWNVSSGTIVVNALLNTNTVVQYFFGHTTGTWGSRIQLYANNGSLCVGMGDSHVTATNIATLALQTWEHIALTWNGTQYSVYLNGTLLTSGTYTGLTNLNSSADIGNDGNGTVRNEAMNGLIDRVKIYNRSLTSDEISTLYNMDQPFLFQPIGNKEVDAGSTLTFNVVPTYSGTTVTLSNNNLPSQPTFANNIFTWTPASGTAGHYNATFTANSGMLEDVETITITVDGINRPPVIVTLGNKTLNVGEHLTYMIAVSDPDGQAVSVTAANMPAGATFTNMTFDWTPAANQTGSYPVQFTASDGTLTTSVTVIFTVNAVATSTQVIIDNTSASTSRTGTWAASDAPGFYGTGSVWSRDGATYTWTFTPTKSGIYDTSMWWTQWPSRSTKIPVSIPYDRRTTTVYINQQLNGGKWNSLGQYRFKAGTSYKMTIASQKDPTSTCADAMKFTFVSN